MRIRLSRTLVEYLCAAGVVTCAVFIAFWPALRGDFVWDDVSYLLKPAEPRELSWASVAWAFSLDATFAGHYQPLTWLSWMLDFAWAGGQPDPFPFHVTNLILHSVHLLALTGLVRLVVRLHGYTVMPWVVVIGVMLYGVHPLRVESVVWITERRDLLCGIFYLLSIWAYIKSRLQETVNAPRWADFALVCFAVSLLCKAWAITFPAVLWAIDRVWLPALGIAVRHSRQSLGQWIKQHGWYVLISFIFAVVAAAVQKHSGAMASMDAITWGERLMQACYGWWAYVFMTLWPVDLAPFYGWDGVDFYAPKFVLAAAGILLGSITIYRFSVVTRPLSACLLSYSAIVFPVLGFAQSGPQMMADRYTFVAVIPWHIAWVIIVHQLLTGHAKKEIMFRYCGLLMIGVLGVVTFKQSLVWLDQKSLWTQVIEVNPNSAVAYRTRAFYATEIGDYDTALSDLDRAQQLEPTNASALVNKANVYLARHQYQEALTILGSALELDPQNVSALKNRLAILSMIKRYDDAKRDVLTLVKLFPADADARLKAGLFYSEVGLFDEALLHLNEAANLDAENPDIFLQRAIAHARLNNRELALRDIKRAKTLAEPGWANAGVLAHWERILFGAARP